jgi:hypothetical protein
MLNLFKNIDLDGMKDQITDLRDQVQDMKFQKPWTSGRSASPVAYMAAGAALTILGVALFRKRAEVVRFCADCGAELKHKWNSLNGKEMDSAPTETTERVG